LYTFILMTFAVLLLTVVAGIVNWRSSRKFREASAQYEQAIGPLVKEAREEAAKRTGKRPPDLDTGSFPVLRDLKDAGKAA
jgi:predicted negative regulator of RcsB-dependent stress response